MDREALSFCHNCGNFFCKDCLNEGKEFYYCSNYNCLEQLKLETDPVSSIEPQETYPEKEFVRIVTELNQMDAAVFESILNDAGIEYYHSGGNIFSSLTEFYILADQLPEVEEILKNFSINNLYYSTKNDLTE